MDDQKPNFPPLVRDVVARFAITERVVEKDPISLIDSLYEEFPTSDIMNHARNAAGVIMRNEQAHIIPREVALLITLHENSPMKDFVKAAPLTLLRDLVRGE